MQLLYCLDGIVQGIHDSEQQDIRAAIFYGPETRVIPYPRSINTLPRVGQPYAWEVTQGLDTRMYGEPPPTPELLMLYSSQVRFDTLTAGILWNDMPVLTDRISQLLIGNLAQHTVMIAPTEPIQFIQETFINQIAASDVPALYTAVENFVQACRLVEAQCLTDLRGEAPTISTYDDVDVRFAALRQQTMYYGQGVRSLKEYYEKKSK